MNGLVLVLALRFGTTPPTRADDGWLSGDKARHFITSALLQSVSFSALRAARVSRGGALAGATVVSATVGVGKELHDKRFGGDPSYKDLVADGAGILGASILLRHTAR